MGIVSPKYDFSFKQLMQNEEVRKYSYHICNKPARNIYHGKKICRIIL